MTTARSVLAVISCEITQYIWKRFFPPLPLIKNPRKWTVLKWVALGLGKKGEGWPVVLRCEERSGLSQSIKSGQYLSYWGSIYQPA